MQNGTLAINDALHTAIIPPAWRLQIGTFDEHIGIDLAAFAIEDVRRSTTVDAIISAATRWIALQPTDVRVTPKRTVVTIHGGVGDVERYQFPLLPAHCVTVHRVQGTTVERDLHLLLNREFFAYGQAYVAL